jgi:lysosomal acid lipase/cholesteryl ester hydrolase
MQAQEINSGQFRLFDYGYEKNMELYRSETPPSYELSEITTPVYLYYGDNDWMAAVRDVNKLAEKLGNLKANTRITRKKFNHMDFIYGSDADSLVYERVIDIIRESSLRD